jgi:hypothetical protein
VAGARIQKVNMEIDYGTGYCISTGHALCVSELAAFWTAYDEGQPLAASVKGGSACSSRRETIANLGGKHRPGNQFNKVGVSVRPSQQSPITFEKP